MIMLWIWWATRNSLLSGKDGRCRAVKPGQFANKSLFGRLLRWASMLMPVSAMETHLWGCAALAA